jgi:Ca-activated chloride channel family protein
METKILLDILTERPVVRNDDVSEFDAVIEINSSGELARRGGRKALNLCVVLDRSGSMSGNKLETAKKSCIDIFNRLDQSDLFTVVVFDDEAQVVINPQTDRNEATTKIRAISPEGMTNLSLGWRLGLLELQTYGTEKHINRLILLSDGQANAGETKVSVLGKHSFKARELGITTSTIGIGEDFNENILEVLASESGGRFWYIGETSIEDIINQEFSDSLAVLLERPRIELQLPEGIRIAKQLNDLKMISGRYRVRPITSNQIFNFAVRLEASPSQIKNDKAVLKAILYDGDEVVNSSDKELPLTSFNEYVVSQDHPVVRSIVQQYEAAKSDEKMRERMADEDFDLMKDIIVSEVEGMRVVRDELAARMQQEQEVKEQQRMNREHGRMLDDLLMMENMEVLLELLEAARAAGATREAQDFRRRLEKLLMHLQHGKKDRWYRGDSDKRILDDLMRSSVDFAEYLISQYPDNQVVRDIREKLNEWVERHN